MPEHSSGQGPRTLAAEEHPEVTSTVNSAALAGSVTQARAPRGPNIEDELAAMVARLALTVEAEAPWTERPRVEIARTALRLEAAFTTNPEWQARTAAALAWLTDGAEEPPIEGIRDPPVDGDVEDAMRALRHALYSWSKRDRLAAARDFEIITGKMVGA